MVNLKMVINNIITAETLREIAESVDANLDIILNRMKSEALAGEDFYIHEEELTHKQLSILKQKGFNIEFNKLTNSYVISW